MAWRKDMGLITLPDGRELVAGRFRGVAFRTVDAEFKVGRRNVVNEYPQRDLPYVDDLGRKARRFVVEAYVIGPNYLAERDALVAAFEAQGPGELMHPRYGLRQVSLDGDVSVKESPERGGQARISVTFVEDAANLFPRAVENTVSKVEATTNAADAAAQAQFAKDFSVVGPSVLAAQAVEGLKGLKATVAGMLQTARQVTSVDSHTRRTEHEPAQHVCPIGARGVPTPGCIFGIAMGVYEQCTLTRCGPGGLHPCPEPGQ
jgi:prophage DNA circulation protein